MWHLLAIDEVSHEKLRIEPLKDTALNLDSVFDERVSYKSILFYFTNLELEQKTAHEQV